MDLGAPGVNILSCLPVALAGKLTYVQQANSQYPGNALTYSGNTTASGITGQIIFCGLGNPEDFPAAVNNNIALIERGTLTFAEKTANAMSAGARAVIIFNNDTGNFLGTLGSDNNYIPTVSLSQADGQTLQAALPATGTVVNVPDPSQIYQYLDGTSMARRMWPGRWRLPAGISRAIPSRSASSAS